MDLSRFNEKWHFHFLKEAKLISECSKDPSTQTGAVLVSENRIILGKGYNGMPSKMTSGREEYYLREREIKYNTIIHCEINALIFKQHAAHPFVVYTWPFLSCSNCASVLINAGAEFFVAPKLDKSNERYTRWEPKFELTRQLLKDCGIPFMEISSEII